MVHFFFENKNKIPLKFDAPMGSSYHPRLKPQILLLLNIFIFIYYYLMLLNKIYILPAWDATAALPAGEIIDILRWRTPYLFMLHYL